MKRYLQRVMDAWTASGGAIFTFAGPIVAAILFLWHPIEKTVEKIVNRIKERQEVEGIGERD